MGIYDRDYYREDEPRGFQLGLSGSVVINLIIVNVAIYVVELFMQIPLSDTFALSADLVEKPWHVWQLVTAGFAHSQTNVWHLIFNMVVLYFFGRDVEGTYGPKLFAQLYFSFLICSNLVWLVATDSSVPRMFWEHVNARGASGAISGVLMLFVLLFPKRTIYLYFLIPVPTWLFGILWIAQDVAGAVQGGDQVAYSAHLGGAAFGWIFYKTGFQLGRMLPQRWSMPSLKRKPPLRVHRPQPQESQLSDEADAILEKIGRFGQDSLTPSERRVLEEYSRRMQQKHR
ncbi:MAG: rhomboid family intramembrane serine protease [Pirellulales bacterium]